MVCFIQIRNPFTCECMCPFEAPPPCNKTQVFDREVCDCVTVTCPNSDSANCTEDEIFSLRECACIPYCNLTCEYPMTLDETSCECTCPRFNENPANKCPPPLIYNDETCFCTCPKTIECIPPQVSLFISLFVCLCICLLVYLFVYVFCLLVCLFVYCLLISCLLLIY